MITFNNIVERFSLFAENHFFIETFSFGSPDDVDLTKFTNFPLMHLVYTGATYDAGTKTYNLEVYILDVPGDKTAKVDRQKEVVSDAEQCAEDIIADIKNGGNIFLFAQDYEVVNATTTPLEEETKNVLSGVLLDLSVAIPYEWDACNAPIDGVEPGGTEVTYARRGVLRMLTLDGATDVPSVRTIKVTNGTLTDNGDGVVTLDTGGVDTLAGLTDVDVTGVTDGQVLKYDDATGEWIPANDQSATSLGNLDDVSLTTPANREALIYDGDNWVNDNVTKADVGLGNVDNTSDADKPVSTATQTALDAKADTSAVPTELNDLSDVTITGTPTGNQALIFDGTANVFKSLPNFTNRFEDEAENNKQGITPFAERVYTVKADGDGIFIDPESDTPTAGKVIVRKIYRKAGFLESGAVIGDFTLIHTFADDTAYSATTSTFEGFRDGDTYGTPPFTLIQTWEEQTAAPAFTGLLNESYGSGAEAAYSTRRLNGNYSGDCMTIRRASDGTTQSIGFVDEEIDESAIETFCSGTTCTVQVWRDQSGNGNDATQTTAANQPTIYTGGQLVKEGGRLAVEFASDGSDGFNLSSTITGVASVMQVLTPSSTANYRFVLGSGNTYHGGLSGTWIMNPDDYTFASPAVYNGDNYLNGTLTNITTAVKVVGTQYLLEMYHDGTTSVSTLSSQSASSVTRSWGGSMQEVILYTSDKSSVRTDIEGNISAYFQSAKLLDEQFGEGAEAAYSTRQLRRDQTECMVIRRASDSTTQTIGFDSNGNIDESAITTFCSGTTCTVYQWRDQSGNGNDATAAASTNEPTIYTGGALVKENGKVALDFDGSNHYFEALSLNLSQPITASMVAKVDDANINYFFDGDDVTNRVSIFQNSSSAGFTPFAGASLASNVKNTNNNLHFALYNGTSSAYHLNGNSIASGNAGTNIADGIIIGSRYNIDGNKLDGTMQELIIYESNQSSNRTNIESNIGDYFTQNTPLLDTYTGAAAAYSLRRLSSSYSGSAIRVRRASDNTEQDIGFNVFGELSTVELAAFCGSSDGFVKTWYSQVGTGVDATQTNTANQPKIYDGTTGGVLLRNGKPYVNAYNKSLLTSLSNVSQPYTISAVFASQNAFARHMGNNTFLYHNSGSVQFLGNEISNGGTFATGDQLNVFGVGNGSSSFGKVANATNQPSGVTFTSSTNFDLSVFFARYATSSSNNRSFAQEFIIWGSDQSSNRSDIEDNINTFYSIY